MSDMAQKIGELKGKAEVKADEVKMKAGELKGKAEAKLDRPALIERALANTELVKVHYHG